MKNFLFSIFICIIGASAYAETIAVEALENFSTAKPSNTLKVRLLSDISLNNQLTLKNGDIVYGNIIDVQSPKRLKRDAKFSFQPIKYETPNGEIENIKQTITANYTTHINKAEVAKSAALTVGNHFVHGISVGYRAVEGAVKNEENNRIKSTAAAVYNSTPISYINKGSDIIIKENDVFLLNFDN